MMRDNDTVMENPGYHCLSHCCYSCSDLTSSQHLRKRQTYGAFFLGESKNGFVISDHTDSSVPKNGRSEKGSFTMTTACPRAPRGKKQQ